ncbi:MAG: lytic transglycosylase domain-containing protein [Chloroflexi bacterium]|nr:MAG: lytic transglycosylase domain-containing protein [Chloroflexota bacterium]
MSWNLPARNRILEPEARFTLDNLHPRYQNASRFQRTAQVQARLVHRGPAKTVLFLQTEGQTPGCQTEFVPPNPDMPASPQMELALDGESVVCIPVRVSLPPLKLIGFRRRLCRFVVRAALQAERPVVRTVMGEVSVPPLIGPVALLGIGLAFLLAVWLAGPRLLWTDTMALAEMVEFQPAPPSQEASTFVPPVFLAGNHPPDFPTPAPAVPVGRTLTYQQMFEEIARPYNLDWRLLAEIAYRESNYNPWAIGQAGEMGLMQILPSTWNEWALKVGATNPYDPYQSVQVAAAYLAYLREFCQTHGYTDPYWMVVGYNWGPDNLQQLFNRQGVPEDVPEHSRSYARRIIEAWPQVPALRQEQLQTTIYLEPLAEP